MTNILQEYEKQKQRQKKKRRTKKKTTCHDCEYSFETDSGNYSVPKKRIYCSYVESIVLVGTSRNCPFFTRKKPFKGNKRR